MAPAAYDATLLVNILDLRYREVELSINNAPPLRAELFVNLEPVIEKSPYI